MKTLFAFALVAFSFTALAEVLKVTKTSPDRDLDRSFVLTTQLKEVVVLDCQSFIQGLRIGEQENAIIFMMDPVECEALQERVHSSLNRRVPYCIDVEDDIRSDYACP